MKQKTPETRWHVDFREPESASAFAQRITEDYGLSTEGKRLRVEIVDTRAKMSANALVALAREFGGHVTRYIPAPKSPTYDKDREPDEGRFYGAGRT